MKFPRNITRISPPRKFSRVPQRHDQRAMRETADVVAGGQVMLGTTMLSASAMGWGPSNFHDESDKGGYMAPEEKRTSPKKKPQNSALREYSAISGELSLFTKDGDNWWVATEGLKLLIPKAGILGTKVFCKVIFSPAFVFL